MESSDLPTFGLFRTQQGLLPFLLFYPIIETVLAKSVFECEKCRITSFDVVALLGLFNECIDKSHPSALFASKRA
jgi:hypothetical protein